jgi:hypothetical protein
MFGAETEYAVAGQPFGHTDKTVFVRQLMNEARRRLRCLSDRHGSGVFLENGSRFYIDCGLHPELSTPECTTPCEIVRYLLAGDKILVNLVEQINPGILIFKGNVDYSGTQTTWGAHESYGHRAPVESMPEPLIPHLASRIIYCGSGGFNPLSPGLEFTLSPRSHHLNRVISENSTHHRGIFHTRNESLSGDGYQRLHILCGDSLFSETALWLKFGTTALVVALIESGICTSSETALKSPLEAIKTFASDPNCRAVARLASGGWASALQLQHYYLTLAEAHLDKPFMPDWAEEVCRRWRAVLEALAEGPAAVATTLDWAIKLALYRHRAERREFAWQSLADWSFVLRQLYAAREGSEGIARPITVEMVRDADSPVARAAEKLAPRLRARRLNWDDLGEFLALREEFFEIETRFGQIDDDGIFNALDRTGKLAHRMPGIDRIDEAMTNPPATGRAYLRGQEVRRLSDSSERYQCDWQGIWDLSGRRWLDLSDPFKGAVEWQAISRPVPELLFDNR